MTLDDANDRLDEAIAELTVTVSDFELAAAADEREHDAAMQGLAEANRKGTRGPEWRTLQERIDRGETTLESIFSGEDTSREAIAVSENAHRNLRALSEQLEEDAAVDPEAFDPRAETEAIAADLARRVAELKQSLGIN